MSGHSKWHSIKHKKGAIDAKRGRLFTKILKEISIAARMGGGDPAGNPRLRTAIQTARDANMPKDNIDRAVKKGSGELPGVVFEDFMYEGYGPGGVAIMIEGTSDNKNRTTPEIRHALSKHGGNLGETGCVTFMFNRKGRIYINALDEREDPISEDAVMEAALEAGAEDFANEGEVFIVTTSPDTLQPVREAIEAKGFKIDSSKIEQVPVTYVKLEGKEAERMIKLYNVLEEHDDINNVFANFDIAPELMEQFS